MSESSLTEEQLQSRYLGSLIGLACCDAVGTTVESKPPNSFPKVTKMTGGGPFKLKPGQWTDDTSMALCLGQSLVKKGKFDRVDQLLRYNKWYHDGYMSSNGKCFDIGGTVRSALGKFSSSGRKREVCGDPSRKKAGNGSLMRLTPVAMAYGLLPKETLQVAIDFCGLSSETTHAAPQCIDACKYYGGLIIGALLGESKETLLSPYYSPIEGYYQKHKLDLEIIPIVEGDYKTLNPPDIAGRGYVVKSMQAALWAFYKTTDFETGCLAAVNLGGDADTTAAIYGMLAGAFYGLNGIPEEWRKTVAKYETLEQLSLDLLKLAHTKSEIATSDGIVD